MPGNTMLRSSSHLSYAQLPTTSAWAAGRGGWEPRGAERDPLRMTLVLPSFC